MLKLLHYSFYFIYDYDSRNENIKIELYQRSPLRQKSPVNTE